MGSKVALYLILVLGSLTLQAQSVKSIAKHTTVVDTYLKVSTAEEDYFCNRTPVRMYLSKHRIIINSIHFNVDIKITKRSKATWYGVDTLGTEYVITAYQDEGDFAIKLSPKTDGDAFEYMISKSKKLCP